jgi:predicted dehydrogenase
MKKKIAVIGAGQLGSRHLQSLALLKEPSTIIVVDPMEQARQIAQEKFKNVKVNAQHRLLFYSDLKQIKENSFDVVIVSTNSSIRFNIIQELLSGFTVKYLILEKFLFPRLEDYEIIGQKLEYYGVECFVNCPRRMFSTYGEIKKLIGNEHQLHMDVLGNSWGLGCNGVHFVDLFQWFSGGQIIGLTDFLDNGYFDSKRAGYIEFSGKINGYSDNGNTFSIISYKSGVTNVSVRVSTPKYRFVINETRGRVLSEMIGMTNIQTEEVPFDMSFQSQLTNRVIEQLNSDGTCQLTSFKEAATTHKLLLNVFLRHYNLHRINKTDLCPIT